MRPDTITLAIEEKYTPEEKAEIAEQLARAIAELETVSGEKKVSDAAFNERIKRCDTQITELAKRYNKGCEVAQIGCDIRYDDPEVGKKSYYRMDRNELVETHDMSWEEKQETLQFPLTNSKEAKPPCEHLTVSSADGIWKCDLCGETLTSEAAEKPLEILGPEPPLPAPDDQQAEVAPLNNTAETLGEMNAAMGNSPRITEVQDGKTQAAGD